MLNKKTPNLPLIATYIFTAIGVITLTSILGYLHLILVPTLNESSTAHSKSFAKLLSQELMHKHNIENEFLLQKQLSKILLYNDSSQETLILGLKLRFNPSAFTSPKPTIEYGVKECPDCFQTHIALADLDTAEVLGNIKYYINPKSHNELLAQVSNRFYFAAVLSLIFISLAWITIYHLLKKITASQKKIIQASQHSQIILNSMLDMIFVIDEKGKILESNPIAQKVFKITQEKLLNSKISDFLQPQTANSDIISLVKNPDNQIIEILFQSNNETHYGILNSSPLKTNNNETSYLLVVKDTHDLQLAQNKLDCQTKSAHLSRLRSLGEMASGIAHEINQPLAIIRLGVEGIKDMLLTDKAKNSLESSIADDVLAQVDRASNIINQMRSFARLESTPKEWIMPSKPITSALSFLRDQLRVHNINLIEDIDYNCPQILLGQQKAEQILINLIINARHALDKVTDSREKQIKVSMHCTQHTVTLTVTDNGIGMSPETLERCFDPFYTTKPDDEGTGLGLSIVKSIAEEFNILLNVKSEPNKGTSFELTMPHKQIDFNND